MNKKTSRRSESATTRDGKDARSASSAKRATQTPAAESSRKSANTNTRARSDSRQGSRKNSSRANRIDTVKGRKGIASPKVRERETEDSAAQKPAAAKDVRDASRSVPTGVNDAEMNVDGINVNLTNLQKIFWPELGLTKRDLLQYYLDVSPWLLPHIQNRAMVMKRYPNGISGDFFFMKRAPNPRPSSIPVCSIEHHSGNVIDFPVVQHTASLLWVINLGCIDLNPWYARCDDVERPDYLHFDLDPVPGASFKDVLETALIVRDALASIEITSYAKTTGSRGIHVYVPIVRGPVQKQVWSFAKAFAIELANRNPKLITAEYRIAKRPEGHVLVDYNQNSWNRTLASVYSVRPKPEATVSTPLTWEEVERGVRMEDFTMKTVPARLAKIGDLWKPLLAQKGRTNLGSFL